MKTQFQKLTLIQTKTQMSTRYDCAPAIQLLV